MGREQPLLGVIIKEKLKGMNPRMTQKVLADKAGINYQTLRKSLSDGQYHEKNVDRICKILNIDKSKYEYDSIKHVRGGGEILTLTRSQHKGEDLHKLLENLTQRQTKFSQNTDRAVEEIACIFEGLKSDRKDNNEEGNLLLLNIAHDMPLHWRSDLDQEILGLIIEALETGLTICYLYPSKTLYTKAWDEDGINLISPTALEREFQQFSSRLNIHKSIIQEHLLLIEYDTPLISLPQHQLSLLSYIHDGKRIYNSSISIPMDDGFTGKRCLIGQSEQFTKELCEILSNMLQRKIDSMDKDNEEKSLKHKYILQLKHFLTPNKP